jgi:hypothetical protein
LTSNFDTGDVTALSITLNARLSTDSSDEDSASLLPLLFFLAINVRDVKDSQARLPEQIVRLSISVFFAIDLA